MSEHTVRSPMPGVFYRCPAPGRPPFAEIGATVTADQTIGIIEVMKQFAEVKAGAPGKVTAFIAENDALLGPGDPVATIEAG
ncbi:acetyl-CoA carboxylase [Streptomyces sp. NPDC000987]|uniref:acetyl-CoA carboxylase n=1 Tax=Streptomyces sp. NPDC000987 TaxID=3154374 RepID=UPI00333075CE